VLFGFRAAAAGQETAWLNDQRAREVAEAAVHAVYPHPCYSTYRQENLESVVVSLRRNSLNGNRINNSVYFYKVASDSCDYVVEKNGKPVRMTQVSMDCCAYGIVAVDRVTNKSYWFAGEKRAELFNDFAHDQQVHPDSDRPTLFVAMYRELVWGESIRNEITSLTQLRDLAQKNFQSAYSPYELDNSWERKFERWWKRFRRITPQLDLETSYEVTSEGTKVRGFAFNGFELTVPRSHLPPKGAPKLFQWTLLVKPNGTVERLPSRVVYSDR
jgi:hypothetical protein